MIATFALLWTLPTWGRVYDIPYGVLLECNSDHAADLALGKDRGIADSNRTACLTNWRGWYKGNVSYITKECSNCTDQFLLKLVNLTAACLDGDDDFISTLKQREGMTLTSTEAHKICDERRKFEAQHKNKEIIVPQMHKAPAESSI